jgi:hypothetical protein
MSIYAKINSENIVENVIVAEQDFIDSLPDSSFYKLGQFPVISKKPRANIGNIYISELDIFVEPKPYASWILDENYDWQPPVPFPILSGDYEWDETIQNWRKLDA